MISCLNNWGNVINEAFFNLYGKSSISVRWCSRAMTKQQQSRKMAPRLRRELQMVDYNFQNSFVTTCSPSRIQSLFYASSYAQLISTLCRCLWHLYLCCFWVCGEPRDPSLGDFSSSTPSNCSTCKIEANGYR